MREGGRRSREGGGEAGGGVCMYFCLGKNICLFVYSLSLAVTFWVTNWRVTFTRAFAST